MKRSVFLGLVFLLFAGSVAAQREANPDREAVRQAVLETSEICESLRFFVSIRAHGIRREGTHHGWPAHQSRIGSSIVRNR